MRLGLALVALLMVVAPLTHATAADILVALEQSQLLRDDATAAGPALQAVMDRHQLTAEWIVPGGVHRGGVARRYAVLHGATSADAAVAELRQVPGVAAAMVAGTRELFWVPNDPHFGTQWHLQPGNPAAIRISEAWDLQTGDDDVLIAVIDTGVDWSHPDLSSNVWVNADEVAGNGSDDDGNGFVDDIRGWDCGNNDWDARPEVYIEQGLDVGFHGTHCAGIAAATTNNGVGVAGTAPGCRIMPLKINNSASLIYDTAITMAFVYAIENGADILSMSFGGPDEGGAAAFYQDLVDQAIAAGAVCVAAAGNSNNAVRMYPAACTGVISVGATDETGQRASFSTYGSWVTVNAPGNRIWSTIQSNYDVDWLTGLLFMMSFGWDGVNPYMYSDGTSMACPMAAGVCGLVLSQDPTLTPAEVRQVLLDTGQNVAFDQPIGVKVDAEAAVASLVVTGAPASVDAWNIVAAPNPFNPRTSIHLTVPVAGPVSLDIVDLRGRLVRRLLDGEWLDAGAHPIAWNGTDSRGRAMPSGVYLARTASRGATATAKLVLAR